jgi:hypothetical protein
VGAYGAMSGALSATVGIENPSGAQAVGPCSNLNSWLMVSDGRTRYSPIP